MDKTGKDSRKSKDGKGGVEFAEEGERRERDKNK